jgi:hypothetical protein
MTDLPKKLTAFFEEKVPEALTAYMPRGAIVSEEFEGSNLQFLNTVINFGRHFHNREGSLFLSPSGYRQHVEILNKSWHSAYVAMKANGNFMKSALENLSKASSALRFLADCWQPNAPLARTSSRGEKVVILEGWRSARRDLAEKESWDRLRGNIAQGIREFAGQLEQVFESSRSSPSEEPARRQAKVLSFPAERTSARL